MECDVCETNKELFKCDGCSASVCKSCGKLTSSETKVLQLNNRVMKFFCQKCRKAETFMLFNQLLDCKNKIIEDKEVIIAAKDDLIKQLKIQLEYSKSNNQCSEKINLPNLSYSQVVKKRNEEVLIVKPKDSTQTSMMTKQKLVSNVSPGTLGVGVSRVRHLRAGGVAVSCSNHENIKTVCETVKKQLGEEYEVQIPDKKMPKIRIYNVDKRLLEDEKSFEAKIILQNTITTDPRERHVKTAFKYETKKGITNVVMELDPNSYREVKKKDRLYIDWRMCYYSDYVNVIQCFKCWRFGHMIKDCKNEKIVCAKCTGEHKTSECESQVNICINCKHTAEVLKVPNVDLNHCAFNRECLAYKRVFNQQQQKVNYPELFETKS